MEKPEKKRRGPSYKRKISEDGIPDDTYTDVKIGFKPGDPQVTWPGSGKKDLSVPAGKAELDVHTDKEEKNHNSSISVSEDEDIGTDFYNTLDDNDDNTDIFHQVNICINMDPGMFEEKKQEINSLLSEYIESESTSDNLADKIWKLTLEDHQSEMEENDMKELDNEEDD